jgi:hypothetical protein
LHDILFQAIDLNATPCAPCRQLPDSYAGDAYSMPSLCFFGNLIFKWQIVRLNEVYSTSHENFVAFYGVPIGDSGKDYCRFLTSSAYFRNLKNVIASQFWRSVHPVAIQF